MPLIEPDFRFQRDRRPTVSGNYVRFAYDGENWGSRTIGDGDPPPAG
jgi:hypothetical protein